MCCDEEKPVFAALCTGCHIKTNNDREHWEGILMGIIEEKYDGKSYLPRGVVRDDN